MKTGLLLLAGACAILVAGCQQTTRGGDYGRGDRTVIVDRSDRGYGDRGYGGRRYGDRRDDRRREMRRDDDRRAENQGRRDGWGDRDRDRRDGRDGGRDRGGY